MIGDKMAQALNDQIREELYSAYLYTAMSANAKYTGMDGTAAWFAAQAREEVGHAGKIYGYLNTQGRQVVLQAIEQPPSEFESVHSMFEGALKHEQHITGCINKLVDLAREENDHATGNFLQWFVNEQVEEEESVNDVLAKLDLAKGAVGALFMIDRELGQRGAAH